MKTHTKECKHMGRDPKTVARLAKRLENALLAIEDEGLGVFGSCWGMKIVDPSETTAPWAEPIVLAECDGPSNGGDATVGIDKTDGMHRLCG